MVTKKARKVTPKSQSEKAAEKKSKAMERAGTALIEGNPKKAGKVLAAQKKREEKKPTNRQAAEILSEAHSIEMQITAQDMKLEGIKESYKEAKSFRERLVHRLREAVRDMKQGRLEFDSPVQKNETQASKDAKSAAAEAPKSDAAPAKGGPLDEIERELGDDDLERVDRKTGEVKAEEKIAASTPTRSKGQRAMSSPAFGAEA